ncbi:TLD-domain-containing protein [Marasmius fiardii PR-910]|nr:TLD-domain-containing protein [Marasmius fiardii PR-910]
MASSILPLLPLTSSASSMRQTQSITGKQVEKRVELRGRRETTEGVLDVELAEKIRTHLPALSRLPRNWNLLYSLDQHGISLNTLYSKVETAPQLKASGNGLGLATRVGALMVIKDADGTVFGVYIGDGIRRGNGRYSGSGESFLWRVASEGKGLEVFKWTGKNNYVALCEAESLSFGGGDGAYGLYIDESLLEGSSARCPTFDNPPLCSSSGARKGRAVEFECVGLEVWGVGP